MTKNESVWTVRDPSGAIVGAGAERRIDQHGILCGDGRFAALDNALGRYSTKDAYRALTRDVEHESANRYEAFGYTLALESLATQPATDAMTITDAMVERAAVALHAQGAYAVIETWDMVPEKHKRDYRSDARYIITAALAPDAGGEG